MKYAVALAGPTASGKTETAIKIAERVEGEIVSADSMQCYRLMNIGTAKPDKFELSAVKHYMIDEYEPTEQISVSLYSERAVKYINEIFESGKPAVITGGSGLYLDSIVYESYDFDDKKTDFAYREKLEKQAALEGGEYLYSKLIDIDPAYAEKTHKNNVKRVIRALEFYHTNKIKMSDSVKKRAPRFEPFLYCGLYVERKVLYARIEERIDKMIASGLIDETEHLYKKGLLSDTAKMAIGYKEIIDYLDGHTDKASAIEAIKTNTRHFAKRQYTWFNADKDIKWFDVTKREDLEIAAEKITEMILNA